MNYLKSKCIGAFERINAVEAIVFVKDKTCAVSPPCSAVSFKIPHWGTRWI